MAISIGYHIRSAVPETSIPERSIPAWVRLVLPSAVDLVFIVLALSLGIGALAPRLLGDAGIGWHIRNGELILHNHVVTRTDPFSASAGPQAWYAWEWLYDAAIAAIHGHLGLSGVVVVTALLIALTFTLVMRLAISAGASLPVTAIFIALAAGASSIHFFARPHVFSWLLTVVWFWTLNTAETDTVGFRRLYWLPALMVLWVNLHGGFVLGFVLLATYLVPAIFRRDPPAIKMLSIVSLLCLAASFINPYGYQLHLHVFRYLSDRFLMDHIDEFQSPNFHGIPQQCFAVLFLLTIAAIGVRREKIRISHLLVLLFAAYSGLFASRNLPVSSILMTLIAAPILSCAVSQMAAKGWTSFAERMTAMERRSRGHIWPLAVSAMLIVACWSGRTPRVSFEPKRFPIRGTDYVEQHAIADPIFCPDYWGGYLIYRIYPHNKVVVDDRHDLYGDEFLKQYLKTIRVEPDWSEFLDMRHVRWALVPTGSSLANMLQQTSQWTIRSQDEVGVLFERD
jgi:hypothetical protein